MCACWAQGSAGPSATVNDNRFRYPRPQDRSFSYFLQGAHPSSLTVGGRRYPIPSSARKAGAGPKQLLSGCRRNPVRGFRIASLNGSYDGAWKPPLLVRQAENFGVSAQNRQSGSTLGTLFSARAERYGWCTGKVSRQAVLQFIERPYPRRLLIASCKATRAKLPLRHRHEHCDILHRTRLLRHRRRLGINGERSGHFLSTVLIALLTCQAGVRLHVRAYCNGYRNLESRLMPLAHPTIRPPAADRLRRHRRDASG